MTRAPIDIDDVARQVRWRHPDAWTAGGGPSGKLIVNVTWDDAPHVAAHLRAIADIDEETRTYLRITPPGQEIHVSVTTTPTAYAYLAVSQATDAWARLSPTDQGLRSHTRYLHDHAHRLLADGTLGQPYPPVSARIDLLATLIRDASGTPAYDHWTAIVDEAVTASIAHPHLAELARAETRLAARPVPRPSATTSHGRDQ